MTLPKGTAIRRVHLIEKRHATDAHGRVLHTVRCQACGGWRSGEYATRGGAHRAAAVHVFERMRPHAVLVEEPEI